MGKRNFLLALFLCSSGFINSMRSEKGLHEVLLAIPGITNPALHKVLGLGEHVHKGNEVVRTVSGSLLEVTQQRTLLDDIASVLLDKPDARYSDVTDSSIQLLCRLYAVTTLVDVGVPSRNMEYRTPAAEQVIDGDLFDPAWTYTMATAALQSYSIGLAADYDRNMPMNDFQVIAYQDAMVAYNMVLGSDLANNDVPRFMMGLGAPVYTIENGWVPANVYAVQQILNGLAHKRAVDLSVLATIQENVYVLQTGVTLASQGTANQQGSERPRRDKMG